MAVAVRVLPVRVHHEAMPHAGGQRRQRQALRRGVGRGGVRSRAAIGMGFQVERVVVGDDGHGRRHRATYRRGVQLEHHGLGVGAKGPVRREVQAGGVPTLPARRVFIFGRYLGAQVLAGAGLGQLHVKHLARATGILRIGHQFQIAGLAIQDVQLIEITWIKRLVAFDVGRDAAQRRQVARFQSVDAAAESGQNLGAGRQARGGQQGQGQQGEEGV